MPVILAVLPRVNVPLAKFSVLPAATVKSVLVLPPASESEPLSTITVPSFAKSTPSSKVVVPVPVPVPATLRKTLPGRLVNMDGVPPLKKRRLSWSVTESKLAPFSLTKLLLLVNQMPPVPLQTAMPSLRIV